MISSWGEIDMKTWKKLYPYVLAKKVYKKEVLHLLISSSSIWPWNWSTKWIDKLGIDETLALYDNLDFLLEPTSTPPFILFYWKGITYHLPRPALKNITYGEFAFLDIYYNLYKEASKTGDEAAAKMNLERLIAYIARPQAKGIDLDSPETSDVREELNTIQCDKRLEDIRILPSFIRVGILLYYEGSKWAIWERYKQTIFATDEKEKSNESGIDQWYKLSIALAENVKEVDEINQMNLYKVLEFLHNKKLLKAKESK